MARFQEGYYDDNLIDEPIRYYEPAPQAAPDDIFSPGGNLTLPATAVPTPPSVISPTTFNTGNPYGSDSPPISTPGKPYDSFTPNEPGVATPPGMKWDPNVASFVPDTIPFDPAGYHMGPNGQLVGNSPAPAPTTPPAASGYTGGPDATILGLLQSGMDPQTAIAIFNQANGRVTGNEAKYYNDNRGITIGLPTGYAALTPQGWTWTVRGPEGPAAAPRPAVTGTSSAGNAGGGTIGGLNLNSLLQFLQPAALSSPSPLSLSLPATPLLPGVNQAGDDELSKLLLNGLTSVISTGGAGPNATGAGGIREALAKIISGGGAAPNLDAQLIAARDAESMAQRGMLSDLRADLANRGMVSEPGVPQGAEQFGMERIAEQLAPHFANAVAEIEMHGLDLRNSNLNTALSLATGLDQSDATNLLQAISLGSNRQVALSQIALQTLDQNRQWQQFLANYGLTRDQVANEIQQGNMQLVIQLINSFLQSVQIGAGGAF